MNIDIKINRLRAYILSEYSTIGQIEDFLGYQISADILEEIEKHVDNVLTQMPEEEISAFYNKYCNDYIIYGDYAYVKGIIMDEYHKNDVCFQEMIRNYTFPELTITEQVLLYAQLCREIDGDVITRTIDIDEAETESRLVEYDLKEKEI